jgi:hypothetical protein
VAAYAHVIEGREQGADEGQTSLSPLMRGKTARELEAEGVCILFTAMCCKQAVKKVESVLIRPHGCGAL